MKIGDIVLFRTEVKDGEKISPSLPAIVYEVRKDNHLALIVFGVEGIAIRRYGHVPHDKLKEECWRRIENYEELEDMKE